MSCKHYLSRDRETPLKRAKPYYPMAQRSNPTNNHSPHPPKPQTYWFHRTVMECPVCGRGQDYVETRFTPKPINPDERFEYEQHYDYCDY